MSTHTTNEAKPTNIYESQISFIAIGSTAISQLRNLHATLRQYNNAPLRDVYLEFGLHPPRKRMDDRVTSLDILHIQQHDSYGFFTLVTKTHGIRHLSLWAKLGQTQFCDLQIDVIGAEAIHNRHFCESLYSPPDNEEVSSHL